MNNTGATMRNGRANYFESQIKVLVVFGAVFFLCGPHLLAQNATREHRDASATVAHLVIDGTTPILLASDEAPVHRAAEDLASDIEKVIGRRPNIQLAIKEPHETAIFIGEPSKLADDIRPTGVTAPESFSISVHRGNTEKPGNAVVLSGSDMRGTIFAVYQFSQEYLGIDPLYYWTDHGGLGQDLRDHSPLKREHGRAGNVDLSR
jgi:hypothetical protein